MFKVSAFCVDVSAQTLAEAGNCLLLAAARPMSSEVLSSAVRRLRIQSSDDYLHNIMTYNVTSLLS